MSDGPHIEDIERMMRKWSDEEVRAFFFCVRESSLDEPPTSRAELERASVERLFWAYNSKTRAKTKRATAQAASGAHSILPSRIRDGVPSPKQVRELHEYATPVGYEFLLRETCKKLTIGRFGVDSIYLLEVYLYEKVIVQALSAMAADERHAFLTRQIDLSNLYGTTFEASKSMSSPGVGGPATTLGALAAAQASGFGVYLGATTAFGFVSHAVGVTLPFAAYTGMTSTISFLIGPLGFLATAAWLGVAITAPEWARIIRGFLHIVIMKAKYEYGNRRLVLAHRAS